jgi:hypothetical protein
VASSKSNTNEEGTDLLSLKDITTSFENHGLTFNDYIEPHNVFIVYLKLNGVVPHVFELNDKKVFIYIFESEKDRKQGKKDLINKTATASVDGHIEFQVKNVIILYHHKGNRDLNIETKILDTINELEKL